MADWHPDVARAVGEYVYVLVDPRDSRPFYVGKGSGNRVFSHRRIPGEDAAVASAKRGRIGEIEDEGYAVQRVILRYGLSRDEAHSVEAAVIDALATWLPGERLTNLVRGHGALRGLETTDSLAARFDPPIAPRLDRPAILVSLNKEWRPLISKSDLRRFTTQSWTANGPRRDRCELIMGVHSGVVRSVYRIVGWKTWAVTQETPRPRHYAIVDDAPEDWDRYVGTDVSRFITATQWSHLYADSEAMSN